MSRISFIHSQQPGNACKVGDTERDHCARIAHLAAEHVRAHGHEVIVCPISDLNGDGKVNFSDNVDWLNELHARTPVQFAISIHTNAAGGSLVAHYPKNAAGRELALALKARLDPVVPDDCMVWDDLLVAEIASTKPTVVLTESFRHDTVDGARFIHENIDRLAVAHAEAVLDIIGRIETPMNPSTSGPAPEPALVPTGRLFKETTPRMRGEDIKQLQREALRVFPGYARPMLGRWGADGIYGDGTADFVEEFQRRHFGASSREVDRKVGDNTRAAMATYGMKGF